VQNLLPPSFLHSIHSLPRGVLCACVENHGWYILPVLVFVAIRDVYGGPEAAAAQSALRLSPEYRLRVICSWCGTVQLLPSALQAAVVTPWVK